MTDIQLYLAIGVPIVFNAAMILMLQHHVNALESHVNARFEASEKLFTEKLYRVEQIIDARLRLIEDKLGINR